MGKYFLHLDAPFVLLLLAEEKNPGAHYELWRSYGYDGIMWPYVSTRTSSEYSIDRRLLSIYRDGIAVNVLFKFAVIGLIIIIINKFIYNPTELDSHTESYTSRIKYKAIKCDATWFAKWYILRRNVMRKVIHTFISNNILTLYKMSF